MPRQRTHHRRRTYPFPDDFPQRLERFKEASGLSWAELARRLGTNALTVRRWRKDGIRPNARHLLALQDLATAWASATCSPRGESGERPSEPEDPLRTDGEGVLNDPP